MGAGYCLSEVLSLLEEVVPRFPQEKTELIRALTQQLRNLGSLQIRNVAVSWPHALSFLPFSLKCPDGDTVASIKVHMSRKQEVASSFLTLSKFRFFVFRVKYKKYI